MSRWALFRDLEAEQRAERAEAAAAELRTIVQSQAQQIQDLVAQLMAAKRDGFDAPPASKLEPQPPRFSGKITAAISQRAAPRSREWAHLESVAGELMAQGHDEEQIVADILAGEDPDGL